MNLTDGVIFMIFIWGNRMNTQDMMTEIRDINLSYLLLAQQMIKEDKASAVFRLGINREIADLIEGLTKVQILKLTSANTMLTRIRFDDEAILDLLTNSSKEQSLMQSHMAILMASTHVEQASSI